MTNQAEKLLTGIEAMVPALRQRAEGAEQAGRIPQETVDELTSLGAFRAVVPERWGGLEVPFPAVPKLFRLMARGCMSTGWTMGFLIYHNFQFAHFGEDAQRDVWGETAQTMAPGQVMPSGEARKVDGGYEVSGRWGYATGIQHGDYMLFSSPVKEEGKVIDMRRFFAPTSEFTVLDTWKVAAMRATGSHDVTVENLFVPEHHTMAVSDLREGLGLGLSANVGPLWRVPLLTFMSLGCVGIMVGGAEALFEIVGDGLRQKVGAYSGDKQAGLMTQKVRFARLAMELEGVVRVYEAAIAEVWQRVQDGDTIAREDRARYRMVVAHTAHNCHRIANELAHAYGSRGNYVDSPVQRFLRDINAMATHALFEYDHIAALHGGVLLDQGLPDSAMV